MAGWRCVGLGVGVNDNVVGANFVGVLLLVDFIHSTLLASQQKHNHGHENDTGNATNHDASNSTTGDAVAG